MTSFQALCGALLASKVYLRPEEPAAPAERSFDAAGAIKLIDDAHHSLPPDYQARFTRPLRANMHGVMGRLLRENLVGLTLDDAPGWRRLVALDYATMLIGSVTDWDRKAFRPSLPALQGAVAGIWRDAATRFTIAGIPQRTDLPPLVNYSARKAIGVHTKKLNRIRQFFPAGGDDGLFGGIVGLPAGYVALPPVWATLAHEVIGHALVNVLPDVPGKPDESSLVNELREALVAKPGLTRFWRDCWGNWIEESIADVCALLGQGPASMLSLAAQVSARSEALDTASDMHVPVMRQGQLDSDIRMGNGSVATEHPPILLRIHVVLGALAVLARDWGPTDPRAKDLAHWRTLLGDIAANATAGRKYVDVVAAGTGAQLLRYDLNEVVALAHAVGAGIAETRLASLNRHNLAGLLAWTEADVAAIATIRAQAAKPHAMLAGSANQLLAGGTMALYDHPDAMAVIAANMLPALEQLYTSDPVFG